MTAAQVLPWVGVGVSLLSLLLLGLAVPVVGYFVRTRDKKVNGLSLRTGNLEQGNAGQAEAIRGLQAGVERIESKLDRALERPPRGEMPSTVDG